MDSHGGFHEMETYGKLILDYHHPKYKPIPQAISGEATSNDLISQLLFLCPNSRCMKQWPERLDANFFPLNCSPEYVLSTKRIRPGEPLVDCKMEDGHPILPLFWCNNEEFDDEGGCFSCGSSKVGTDYYFCECCQQKFHKECVESPPKIKHPYHPRHPLQLYHYLFTPLKLECLCCGRQAYGQLGYSCTICQAFMHTVCAMKLISFVIDQPKRHHHPLTFFPRQTSLTCNVCGLLRKIHPTYVCLRCNFVAHIDCMYSSRIIKISRHHHRISYIPSLQSTKWSCGVCHQSIDGDYGAYTCEKCGDYAVHSRCGLRKDVCDGLELEGVPEEDDIEKDDGPFIMISEGVILHFLHEHHLFLNVNIVYDENKLCEACVIPIYEGNFYSCMECDFIIHETCANTPRRIQHALHPHPLTLKSCNISAIGAFKCYTCDRFFNGFVYQCHIEECYFEVDVRCASISEPFDYKGHKHPLFAALNLSENPICHICKEECYNQLNCIKCNFVVCIKCATLPYRARYQHEEHFLTILYGEKACENDWCEVCERNLGNTKVVYWCKECCAIFHIECLFGRDPYMKLGQYFQVNSNGFQVLPKSNVTRPICYFCMNSCQGKIFEKENRIACSLNCLFKIA